MNDLSMKNCSCENCGDCCCSVRLTLAIVLLALALVVSNAAWFFHAVTASPRVASSVSGSQRITVWQSPDGSNVVCGGDLTVDGERVSSHV